MSSSKVLVSASPVKPSKSGRYAKEYSSSTISQPSFHAASCDVDSERPTGLLKPSWLRAGGLEGGSMASGSGSSNRKRKRVEDLKLGNSLIQVGDHDAGGGSKHRYEDPKRETDKKNMVEPPESTLENGVHEFSDFQNKHLGVTSHGHPLEHRGVDSSASKRISSLATKILAKAHQLDGSADDGIRSGGATRDQDAMTIIETLELGPKDHGCHSTEWEKVEPNSGIRLRSRTLEHEVVQAHLSQRYYLPPSLLYSVMRLSRDRQTFEVPVEGDWVTIAVVCHVKSDGLTKGRPEKQPEERRNEPEDTKEFDPNPRPPPPPRGRVFYNGTQTSNQPMENHGGSKHFASIKLCALPSRSKNGAIEQAGGDAMLNLMLFAADGEVKDPVTGQTVYRGGSGGAYEKYWKLTVGTVVGLVSPKLMKPYGGAKGAIPHPLSQPIGITPNSERDLFVIGHSMDLSYCTATKKDGERCRNWVDKRINKVCEFHLQNAVQRSRGGRAEFAISTSSMALSSQSGYDGRPGPGPGPGPASASAGSSGGRYGQPFQGPGASRSKFGLKPSGPTNIVRDWQNDGGGQMYVVGGKAFHSDGRARKFDDEFVGEKLGRERTRKMVKQREAVAMEKQLEQFLDRDRMGETTGGKYLRAALGKDLGASLSGEIKTKTPKERAKGPFHADALKKIGFDPRQLSINQSADPNREKDRQNTISSLRTRTAAPKLGPMPGKQKSLTSVSAPTQVAEGEHLIELSDSE